jgi:hypothetical protein
VRAQLGGRAARGWALFEDWCWARDVTLSGSPGDAGVVEVFAAQCPSADVAVVRRVLAPLTPSRRAVRDDLGVFGGAERAAEASSVLRFTRDTAVLCVAYSAAAGLSRVSSATLRDGGVLAGEVGGDADPVRCGRCWVCAWRTIRGGYVRGGRHGASAAEAGVHDWLFAGGRTHLCALGGGRAVDGGAALFVAVDRHGWMGDAALSARSIRSVRAARARPVHAAAVRDVAVHDRHSVAGRGWDEDLLASLDGLDAGIDAASARISEALSGVSDDLALVAGYRL